MIQLSPLASRESLLSDILARLSAMPSTVTIQVGGADLARTHIEPICQVYQAAFAKPPFNRTPAQFAEQRSQLDRLLQEPSFGASLAFAGSELVGFLYGYALPPTTHWWEGFVPPVDPAITEECEGRTFALIYLAVADAWRRQGIGRRLVTSLLADRPEERATVAAIPAAVATQAFYRRLGWRHVGRQEGRAINISSTFDIYAIPLATGAAEA
jgi:ribosomal protein S18 acetylase RimI-like enzyme